MPIKSFRGQIAHDTIDTVLLHTIDGSMGYRIKTLQVIPNNPTAMNMESVLKIYKVPQTTTTNTIDFSDNTLLGASFLHSSNNALYEVSEIIVFDNEIFNQDIYITHNEPNASAALNYYIELEQMKLDLNENTVATLKDIRNVA
jgi:hypothetical protein